MKRKIKRLSTAGLMLITLLSACQKEDHSGHFELIAEGMNSNGKMFVDGVLSYWQTGDKVNINGVEKELTVNRNSNAYIENVSSANNYLIVFPSNIYNTRNGNIATVNLPSTYEYVYSFYERDSEEEENIYKQSLSTPMAYYGAAEDFRAKLKHLTGALNIRIEASDDFSLNKIVVSTVQNYVLSGEMNFDITNINGITSSAVGNSTNNSITILFNSHNNMGSRTVQVPVPVISGNVNFVIKVEGELLGTQCVFERTQITGGHLGRAEMANVNVNMNEGQPGVTLYPPFEIIQRGDTSFYKIQNSDDLKKLNSISNGLNGHYGEYGGVYYRDANYIFTEDIDMTGVNISQFGRMTGVWEGDNHTIQSLAVACGSSETLWGLFKNGGPQIKNLTFNGLRLFGQYYQNFRLQLGALNVSNLYNVHISDFEIPSNFRCLKIGGFSSSGVSNIQNCSLSFKSGQVIYANNNYSTGAYGPVFGGICGSGELLNAENVTVDFSDITFISSYYHRCMFGGLVGNATSSISSVTNVSIIGNVTLQGMTVTNSTFVGKVYVLGDGWDQAYEVYDELEGVDVSGLTITVE